jgi:hypothetical protein
VVQANVSKQLVYLSVAGSKEQNASTQGSVRMFEGRLLFFYNGNLEC